MCFPCAAGTYQPNEGQDICLPCAAGFFGVEGGQTSCDDACPAGMYATGGATSCFAFTTETLKVAVKAWCNGDYTTYPHISTWKTGGVNDMTLLFAPYYTTIIDPQDVTILARGGCGEFESDFADDISKWDGKQSMIGISKRHLSSSCC